MTSQPWDGNHIPDLQGRIAIVTGSSSGIGYEAARVLATKNASVIIAVRNLEKGNTAAQKIKSEYPDADVAVMELDLANLASVRHFAAKFKEAYDRLDVLINNAGVMMPPFSKTDDGFELQMGTNHLGHFALTGLLIERLKQTPDSRIVNVSSMAHKSGNIDFDDLGWDKRPYKPMKAYGDSKIANLYFTSELARRLGTKADGPIVAAAHPGWTATDLQRHSGLFNFLNPFLAQKIPMGALPTLLAATGPDVQNGDYFGPSGFMEMKGYPKKVEGNKLSKNQDLAKQLWTRSEELTGIWYSL